MKQNIFIIDALAWKFTNSTITFSVAQDMLNLVVSLFYPVTVENFEKLTFEIFIFFTPALMGPREKIIKVEYFRNGIKFLTNTIYINLKIKASFFKLNFVNYT